MGSSRNQQNTTATLHELFALRKGKTDEKQIPKPIAGIILSYLDMAEEEKLTHEANEVNLPCTCTLWKFHADLWTCFGKRKFDGNASGWGQLGAAIIYCSICIAGNTIPTIAFSSVTLMADGLRMAKIACEDRNLVTVPENDIRPPIRQFMS